jgi:hypothetical protein
MTGVLQASMSTGDRDIFPDILNIPNRNMAEQHFSMPQDHQVHKRRVSFGLVWVSLGYLVKWRGEKDGCG